MLIHKPKEAVVLRPRDPDKITNVIAQAKKVLVDNKILVAVRHTVPNAKVLRNMGYKVPAPIRYYYKWPGQYTPFKAQLEAAAFLTTHSRAFNLSELGTGKSLSALWAYDYLRSIGELNKVLIISPLSTLERTWADEIFTHFPHLEAAVLHGTKQKRLKLLNNPDFDAYIINHDGVGIVKDALKDRDDIDLVIIDEISQAGRNAGTNRWRALNEVINKQKSRAAWGLTGTPTPNDPTDAWAQCRLLVPDMVPPYFNRFRSQVMTQVSPFTWVPKKDAVDVVQQVMTPSVRFTRDECMDLPPLLYGSRHVALTKDQNKAYEDMLTKLSVEFEEGEVTAVNEAVKLAKLVQIACGVVYDSEGNEVTIDNQPRIDEVLSIVRQASGKVIVFVPFVSSVERVCSAINEHFPAEFIHGGVKKNDRDRIFRGFQKATEPHVIVAQPAAMSHGLTLTAASDIVWYAPVTSNETFEQANGRINRPGQKNTNYIVMLEGTSTERRIYSRLKNKQKVQGALLDIVKSNRGEVMA